jgi:hypothetical protein
MEPSAAFTSSGDVDSCVSALYIIGVVSDM